MKYVYCNCVIEGLMTQDMLGPNAPFYTLYHCCYKWTTSLDTWQEEDKFLHVCSDVDVESLVILIKRGP